MAPDPDFLDSQSSAGNNQPPSPQDGDGDFGVDRPLVAVTQQAQRPLKDSADRYSRAVSSGSSGEAYAPPRGGRPLSWLTERPLLLAVIAGGCLIVSLLTGSAWLGIPAALITLVLAGTVLWQPLDQLLKSWLPGQSWSIFIAGVAVLVAIAALITFGAGAQINLWVAQINWDAVGALAELFGAVGQIFVAFLALYVAWRQYVISKELTSQQNRITQQQTIDAYFQGVSDLILDEEGLLEDWPPERAIAEGRTAAILSGVDAEGKAKILRFLSSSKLLTPLKRDRRLGRPIFDGLGGYAEDIEFGVRVIDLAAMLAGANLANTDLRSTDLSEANLVGANLSTCDFTRANLSRAVLYEANLVGADLSRTRLFYGEPEQATPRDRLNPPNYTSGAQTGAVVEKADLSGVLGLSAEQRYYCCAWGGSQTRATIPGGCEGIPNKLGR